MGTYGDGRGRMDSSRSEPGALAEGAKFVFDGDCRFCSSCARLIVRWIPTDARVVAWQLTDIAALGLDRDQVQGSVQWIGPDNRRTSGPDAIADLLFSSRRRLWRVLGGVLTQRRVMSMARPTYAWVSAHRDRLPLGPAITDLPAAEQRRFSDWR